MFLLISRAALLEDFEFSVKRIAEQDHEKDQPLKNENRRVGQLKLALQNTTAGENAAQHRRDENDRQAAMSRDECDENSCVAVARRERFIRATLNGGDFDHAGDSRRRARQKTGDESKP